MKSVFIKKNKNQLYDGSQLTPLYTYQNYKVSGDSIISWVGPCRVSLEHMVDYEDKIAHELICGDLMLHFMIEVFPSQLAFGVSLQRIFASLAMDLIQELTPVKMSTRRSGDDIYVTFPKKNEGKLSISIASVSAVSTMIHFALNITNDGTPVKTASLNDLKIDAEKFSKKLMNAFCKEYESILFATVKVKPLA